LKDLSSVVKGQFAENQLKNAIYVSESAASAAK